MIIGIERGDVMAKRKRHDDKAREFSEETPVIEGHNATISRNRNGHRLHEKQGHHAMDVKTDMAGLPHEEKAHLPIVAICYDFDKTLSPSDMQAQGFIQSLDCEISDFWKDSNELAERNEMDQNLAYMYMMIQKAHGKVLVTRASLERYGRQVTLFPGVTTWFQRMNEYGQHHGVQVEHYIISSGLKEMIEGTPIAHEFTKIYASSFYYDRAGVAVWPAQAVNFTNKTQFLFRIEKGTLDVNDQAVNDYTSSDEYRVPFRNMVYIGDSDTDIPCMKLVNTNGGHSIGVYDPTLRDRTKVCRMLTEHRIRYFAPADYSKGSELSSLVECIIDRTAVNERLEQVHFACHRDTEAYWKKQSEEDKAKNKLISQLEDSVNFASTHSIIEKLSHWTKWNDEQRQKLIHIALTNTQVLHIINDEDIGDFYAMICERCDTKEAQTIKTVLE